MAARRRWIAAAAPALVIACLAGCGGDSSPYARYQDQAASLKATDAMLIAIPQFPGAQLQQGTVDSTSYQVSTNHVIRAEPYARRIDYAVPARHSGAEVQGWFREHLITNGWICTFNRRVRGVPYGFSCTKQSGEVSAYIADDGHYQLGAAADSRPAPIKTVTALGD